LHHKKHKKNEGFLDKLEIFVTSFWLGKSDKNSNNEDDQKMTKRSVISDQKVSSNDKNEDSNKKEEKKEADKPKKTNDKKN
jgi:hypothetical protein